jgi:hypothetical protein
LMVNQEFSDAIQNSFTKHLKIQENEWSETGQFMGNPMDLKCLFFAECFLRTQLHLCLFFPYLQKVFCCKYASAIENLRKSRRKKLTHSYPVAWMSNLKWPMVRFLSF